MSLYGLLAALALSLTVSPAARAQADAQLTQHWAVPAYYNPAMTGDIDFIHITAGSRLQWVGVRHAPMTFMALADMPFKFFGRRWGVGVRLQQESIGLYKSIQAGAQLSFKQRLPGGTLSGGIQLGMVNESFDGSKVIMPEGDEYHSGTDDAIPQNTVAGTAFDLSAGVSFRHKWFWAGFSCTHISSPTVTMKADGDEEKQYEFEVGRTCYFTVGSNIPIKNTLFELQPSILVKSDFTFFQGEATFRVRYNKFLSAGVGYRYKDAVMLMLGADYKNFFLGYSYDYNTSAIRTAGGSHEVFLGYNVKLDMGERNRNKHKSIRIM